jgi:hypothetical protein
MTTVVWTSLCVNSFRTRLGFYVCAKKKKLKSYFTLGRCIQHYGYMLGRYKNMFKTLKVYLSIFIKLTIMITKVPKLIKKSQAMRSHVLSTNHPSTNNENMFSLLVPFPLLGYFQLIGPQKKCGCTCPFF